MIVWRIEVMRSADAPQELLDAIRGLLVDAFDDGFTPEDWEHALGGHHVIAMDGGAVVAHAAVVARHFDVGGRAVSVGYVEAVATDRNRRGQGVGSGVMRAAGDIVRAEYELGALSTGAHEFYERLGWTRWQGPTFVRRGERTVRTPDEDDGVMVLVTDLDVDLTSSITCEERAGDDW